MQNWRKNPKVQMLREYAKRFKCDRVVCFHFNDDGTFGYASYGTDGRRCKEAERLGNVLFETLEDA